MIDVGILRDRGSGIRGAKFYLPPFSRPLAPDH
jgi:hypothetical protein